MIRSVLVEIAMGSGQAGLTDLRAQLISPDGSNFGDSISTGFTNLGEGNYQWSYSGVDPSFTMGSVKFYSAGNPSIEATTDLSAIDFFDPYHDRSYLNAAEARSLGTPLAPFTAGMNKLLALSDDGLQAALVTASADIDVAMRYQGRKYDPLQHLEFPRIDASPAARQYPPAPPSINDPSFYVFGGSPTFIWDWDPRACNGQGKAVVPHKVKEAALHQATWLMRPEFADRLEMIRSGLYERSIATAREVFIRTGDVAGGFTGLGNRALQIMSYYRLRTGRLM